MDINDDPPPPFPLFKTFEEHDEIMFSGSENIVKSQEFIPILPLFFIISFLHILTPGMALMLYGSPYSIKYTYHFSFVNFSLF
jgi:hypothetical protein